MRSEQRASRADVVRNESGDTMLNIALPSPSGAAAAVIGRRGDGAWVVRSAVADVVLPPLSDRAAEWLGSSAGGRILVLEVVGGEPRGCYEAALSGARRRA
jgi:hypothetical protein